jgi:hypothetical protein
MDELLEETASPGALHTFLFSVQTRASDDSFIGGLFAGRRSIVQTMLSDWTNRYGLSPAGTIESGAFLSQFTGSGADPEIGHTVGARYFYDDRDIGHTWTFREISENFRANMGYITRTGIVAFSGSVRPKLYPSSTLVQRLSPELFSAQTFDEFSDMWETYNHASLSALFRGNLAFTARYIYATEIFGGERFQTGGISSRSADRRRRCSGLRAYQHSRAVLHSLAREVAECQRIDSLQPSKNSGGRKLCLFEIRT